ncbi:unnamed protein product [Soboliphyme baturini]|uniref:CS domain-containing protein n=1 Tax=Soboliphyme baturini TaxID=241478 RepID=A0A183J2I5_9BILA|nr:unnamed protein product [Soboliphyme baturini]
MAKVSGSGTVLHAPIEWAQRDNILFLTICVDDCKAPEIDIKDDKLTFKGFGGHPEIEYQSEIEFYKPVDAEKAKRIPSDRHIQYVIPKKEAGPFWPRLVLSKQRAPWIKVDFNKWKDEDEDSADESKWNMNDFGGGAGAGGMFGGSGKNNFGDLVSSLNLLANLFEVRVDKLS